MSFEILSGVKRILTNRRDESSVESMAREVEWTLRPKFKIMQLSLPISAPRIQSHQNYGFACNLIGKRWIYRNYYSPKNENVVQYNTFLEKFGQCEDVFDKNKERIERKDYRNIFTERVM